MMRLDHAKAWLFLILTALVVSASGCAPRVVIVNGAESLDDRKVAVLKLDPVLDIRVRTKLHSLKNANGDELVPPGSLRDAGSVRVPPGIYEVTVEAGSRKGGARPSAKIRANPGMTYMFSVTSV